MNTLIGIFLFLVVTLFVLLIFGLIMDYQINKLTKSVYERYGAEPPDDNFKDKYLK